MTGNNNNDILYSWKKRIKITSNNLKFEIKKFMARVNVKYKPNLAEKYLGKYFT